MHCLASAILFLHAILFSFAVLATHWKSLCNDIVNPVYRGARRKHLNLPPFKLCYSTNKSLCAVLTNLGQHTGSH